MPQDQPMYCATVHGHALIRLGRVPVRLPEPLEALALQLAATPLPGVLPPAASRDGR